MRIIHAEVPYMVTFHGIYRSRITEEDICRKFGTQDLDTVDSDLIDDFIREETYHRAFDQPIDRLIQTLQLRRNIDVFEDQVEILDRD